MLDKNSYTKNIIIAVPFLLLTIAPFVLVANALEIRLDIKLVALGAVGWWIALLLRLPVMLLASRSSQAKGQTVVVLASGPAEELVRLGLLLILGLSTKNAYSVGLGWAAIEIIYSIIQGFGMAALQRRTDGKAVEAKKMLRTAGMDKTTEPSAPYWGIVERLGANALHLGFSLLLVVSPYLVVVTAPLHSAANLGFTRLLKRSFAVAELIFVVFGVGIFALSLALVRA